MRCECSRWQENQPKLDSLLVIAHVHGTQYDGESWEYCPWCGSYLRLSGAEQMRANAQPDSASAPPGVEPGG